MTTNAPSPRESALRRFARLGPAVWLATGAGVGFVRWAPGTFGSLWGLLLALGVGLLPFWAGVAVIAALCAVGVPLCSAAARRLNAKDPPAVVWDEIAALPITFFLVDLPQAPLKLAAVLAIGFVLFRLFDIVKPPPAPWLERLPRGLGIMADDWSAGVYACLSLHAILWLRMF